MLDISDDSGLRVITLARPPVNALNGELTRQLVAAVEGASESGAVVIAGQPGLFSAGLDVPGLLMLTLRRRGDRPVGTAPTDPAPAHQVENS